VDHISQKLQEQYGELIQGGQFHGIHAKQELEIAGDPRIHDD
jgi:hypothetical protein